MSFWEKLALFGGGFAIAKLLEPRRDGEPAPVGPATWPIVEGESGLVLEPDFAAEEFDDIHEAEAYEGYWVRIDGRTVGKVHRSDAVSDAPWRAGIWTASGEWVEFPHTYPSKENAGWAAFQELP